MFGEDFEGQAGRIQERSRLLTEAFDAMNVQVDGAFETLRSIEVWRDDLH